MNGSFPLQCAATVKILWPTKNQVYVHGLSFELSCAQSEYRVSFIIVLFFKFILGISKSGLLCSLLLFKGSIKSHEMLLLDNCYYFFYDET